MDMKKILAAVDGKVNKEKTSSDDMKKFLSIITESTTNRLSVAEQMAVQHYQEPRKDITSPVLNKSKDAVPSMIGKYFKAVEQELQEAADRSKDRATQLAKRVIERVVPGQEVPQDINRLTGKPIVPEPKPVTSTPAAPASPRGSNLKMTVLQQLKAGTYKGFAPNLSPEEIDAAIEYKQNAGDLNELESRYKDRASILAERVAAKMNERTSDVDSAVKDYLAKGGEVKQGKTHKPRKSEKTDFGSKHIAMKGEIGKGKASRIGKASKSDPTGKPVVSKEDLEHLIRIRDNLNEQISQLEEFYNAPPTDSRSPISGPHQPGCKCKEVEEGLRDPKDNPCWKGYKPVGTKQKGGRTVPNCVPKESTVNEISKGKAQKYLDKTVDPVHGMPKPGMDKRMKGIEGASKRVSGQKPTSKNEGVQKTGEAGQLKGRDTVDVKGSLLASSKEKSQKGLRNKLVGGGT